MIGTSIDDGQIIHLEIFETLTQNILIARLQIMILNFMVEYT